MSTHQQSTTDRTARTTDQSDPTLTDGRWRDESAPTEPTDAPIRNAPQQFSATAKRRLPNLVDATNRFMLVEDE